MKALKRIKRAKIRRRQLAPLLPMPISEQDALEAARRFIRRERRNLAYPVNDVPVRQRRVQGSGPPSTPAASDPIGSDFWEFYFEYQPPPSLLVDPTCARVLVDSTTGAAALFSPGRR